MSRTGEQIGELRSMMIERDKNFQRLDANANRAIDLVETVQPEKLMVEMRKSDSKTETLKANLESNEFVLNNMIKEMKDMRNQMTAFKGLEQVIKLNEEVKGELLEIKRVKAIVERHSDKVETIFTELQQRFSEFEKIKGVTDSLDKSSRQLISDIDSIGIKIAELANKRELESLINKFHDFEKHAGNILSLVDKRFKKLEEDVDAKLSQKVDQMERLVGGFKTMLEKTPDLDKFFHLLEKKPETAEAPQTAQPAQPQKIEEKLDAKQEQQKKED